MLQTSLKIVNQLEVQREREDAPLAVFTDLDGTFVVSGNKAATAAADKLFRQTQTESYPIIAITGRSVAWVLAEVERGDLPSFNAVIGAVGTEIMLQCDDGSYEPDTKYASELSNKYDRHQILMTATELIKSFTNKRPDIALRFQKTEEEQKFPASTNPVLEPYKISLHFTASSDSDIDTVRRLFEKALPKLKIIISEEIYHNKEHLKGPKKYNLDILPASKSEAISYIMKTYGIEQGVVAGDSGNDVDALLVPGLVGVLVGGHRPEAVTRLEIHGYNKDILIDMSPARAGAESILLALKYLRGTASERKKISADFADSSVKLLSALGAPQ